MGIHFYRRLISLVILLICGFARSTEGNQWPNGPEITSPVSNGWCSHPYVWVGGHCVKPWSKPNYCIITELSYAVITYEVQKINFIYVLSCIYDN